MIDPQKNYSPEEISQIGEQLYFNELKDELDKTHNGEYLVIDVERKEYVVNADKLAAIEEARKKFGNKLFHIIQIGSIQKPVVNLRAIKYVWKF